MKNHTAATESRNNSALIKSLDAVSPGSVPCETSTTEWIQSSPLGDAILALVGSPQRKLSNTELAGTIRNLLAEFPLAGKPAEEGAGQADELAHDAYFHVRRRDGDEPAVFVRSVLAARLVVLEEATDQAVNIDQQDLEILDRGFADLLTCLFAGKRTIFQHVTLWHSTAESCDAMQRWVHGHLAFAVLSQGLTFSFRSMGDAFRLGRTEAVQKWADLSISLLDASGASFVFTGDFPAGEYENTIRPSMTPPSTPICLSGLMSADHRLMAQTIRDMRPVLKSIADHEPERHERIAQAMSGVYDRHIFVCERFAGVRPSILTAGRTERTGPSLIEQFRTLRLRPFEHSSRATVLSPERTAVSPGQCPFKH